MDNHEREGPRECISTRMQLVLRLYAVLLERGGIASIAAIAMTLSIFQIVWTVFEAAGAVGRPLLLVLILLISLVVPLSLIVVRQIRWAVIDWAVGASLKTVRRRFDPRVIVGIGRGGAHVAALLCHKLAQEYGIEPYFAALDRVYFAKGRSIGAGVSDLSDLKYDKIRAEGNVLLVTAEVHSGNTLKAASERLDEHGVAHETFTITHSPSAGFKVSFYVVKTDLRNLLPWPSSPLRKEMLGSSE